MHHKCSSVRQFLHGDKISARGLTKLHIIPQETSVDSSYYISEILEKEVKPAFSWAVTGNCDKAVFEQL